ncbi:hypothetical protein HDU90_008775 [Geranomyces variabilis]|nr:hypothetical protein HDU90_008775 [Geranomyces variabilis]
MSGFRAVRTTRREVFVFLPTHHKCIRPLVLVTKPRTGLSARNQTYWVTTGKKEVRFDSWLKHVLDDEVVKLNLTVSVDKHLSGYLSAWLRELPDANTFFAKEKQWDRHRITLELLGRGAKLDARTEKAARELIGQKLTAVQKAEEEEEAMTAGKAILFLRRMADQVYDGSETKRRRLVVEEGNKENMTAEVDEQRDGLTPASVTSGRRSSILVRDPFSSPIPQAEEEDPEPRYRGAGAHAPLPQARRPDT